jgi:hypothetical protein
MDENFIGLPENQKKGLLARSVMEGLTQPDPGKRLDCAEALEIYYPESKVLQLPGIKAWLQEQKSLRKELEKML